LVGCKWVYKRKLGAYRDLTTFTARLMEKRYTQRPKVDFEESNLPVAKAKSILLVIAARKVSQLLEKNRKDCRLQRSIYGLEQASRSWIINFGEVIRGYDFIKNKSDPCAYKKINRSSVMYLVLDVDDILFIGNDVKILGNKKDGYPLNFPWRIW
ncbi:UNVERIFIED_CONTAM: hypothetical protein Sindi_2887000, partial [Sesamum indicum]